MKYPNLMSPYTKVQTGGQESQRMAIEYSFPLCYTNYGFEIINLAHYHGILNKGVN